MEKYKVFVDTNVVLDLLLNREGASDARSIFMALAKGQCIVSVSSFYTIAFYVEKYLKKNNILGEEKLFMLRSIMNDLLNVVTVSGVDEARLRVGINDTAFTDLEDSFQLQTAISTGCNVIITGNTKDFKQSAELPVVSPKDFISSLSTNGFSAEQLG